MNNLDVSTTKLLLSKYWKLDKENYGLWKEVDEWVWSDQDCIEHESIVTLFYMDCYYNITP